MIPVPSEKYDAVYEQHRNQSIEIALRDRYTFRETLKGYKFDLVLPSATSFPFTLIRDFINQDSIIIIFGLDSEGRKVYSEAPINGEVDLNVTSALGGDAPVRIAVLS